MYKILEFGLGREALRYLIKVYNIKEINIPYYLCDVIRHTLAEEKCKPIFYHVDDNFYPIKEFSQDEYVLYPNYFGVCTNNVKKLADKYRRLIVDNAHAYFDKPCGFACFNAGHKFGYKNSILWYQGSIGKASGSDTDDSKYSIYRKIFLELHSQYKSSNLLNFDTDSVSFVYPYLADSEEKADKLAAKIKEEGKNVYRYWNPLPKSYNEYKFYSRLVPIPILPC